MIDYVKISLKGIDIVRLLQLPYLDFKTIVSKQTGVLGAKEVAEYHYCKITLFDSGLLLFTGSIHKFYNSIHNINAPNYKKGSRGYNGTLFTLSNILEVRTHLTLLFDCKPQQMQFQNIEFGINAEVTFNPQKFIKGLLYQKGKKFEFRYNDYYAQVVHQRYILKVYNKSNQYGMTNHTLRVETKELKAIDFAITGINTFEDVNTQTLENAKQLLLKRFDEVVYYDYSIKKKLLLISLKKKLVKYSNPRYWIIELKSNHRDREKKKLKKIINDYSDNLHNQLRQEIVKKCVIINRFSK